MSVRNIREDYPVTFVLEVRLSRFKQLIAV